MFAIIKIQDRRRSRFYFMSYLILFYRSHMDFYFQDWTINCSRGPINLKVGKLIDIQYDPKLKKWLRVWPIIPQYRTPNTKKFLTK